MKVDLAACTPVGSLVAVALGALAGCGSTTRSPRTGEPVASITVPRTFEVHGHRGATGRYPENTIDGFVAALGDGADVLETDLLLTRDGVLVLHHNVELNPDTARDESGSWLARPSSPILTMTAAELARYDVGRIRPGTAYAAKHPHQRGRDGVRIPTLSQALVALDQASSGRARWNLEIKIATDQPDKTAAPDKVVDATLALLREHGVEDRVMIQSFDWRVIQHVRSRAPALPTGCLTEPNTVQRTPQAVSPYNGGLDIDAFGGSVPRMVHAAGCAYWTPKFTTLTAADVALAHELGLRVVPWTVDEPADMRRVIALGVDGLITDYPDRILQQ